MTLPPVNVADHLARMAAAHPDRPALHYPPRGVRPDGPTPHVTRTFAELNAEADALAHGLAAAGVVRGTRTVLMVPPSSDFFALTFALFKLAAVPVLIDPGMGVRNLGRCLAEAEPEAFVGVPKAHLARRLLGWAKRSLRVTVNVGRRRLFCRRSTRELRDIGLSLGPYPSPAVAADETAAVLFTSGSTGPAKGARYAHGNFAAQVEALRATYGIEPGEVDLCTFPLFALFGPALGMTCVVPDMDFTRPARIDPRKAAAQVRQFGVTNLFGSPAVLRRFGDLAAPDQPVPARSASEGWHAKAGEDPRSRFGLVALRRVISAGAPVPASVIERFTPLLSPGVEVFTPYGATEALPVASVGSREILGETRHLTDQGKGVCVGRPVPGMTVYVIPISDGPIPIWDEATCLPPGEVGEFVVRGAVVTTEYFRRPEATKLAKIVDERTGEVLHRMGDVGYFDDRGRLWYCGRKSHRVVTPHGTLFPEMVEGVFNTVWGVLRTAFVGVTRGEVTYPVVCVELTGLELKAGSWQELESRLFVAARSAEHTRSIGVFLMYDRLGFPVDVRHNAKIFREKLAVWADKRLGPNWNPGAK
jgi:acyl-CoA synthetase (AMP-forming)/AMP-acid ligase II